VTGILIMRGISVGILIVGAGVDGALIEQGRTVFGLLNGAMLMPTALWLIFGGRTT